MAIITNYGTLKTAVADYVARSDLTTFVPNFIQAAENRIYRELRVRQMLNSTPITFVASDITEALPTGYLEMQRVAVQGDPYTPMERSTSEIFDRTYPVNGSPGRPRLYRTTTTNLVIAPAPDASYTLQLDYYKRESAMSADGDAPWIVTDAPEMVLAASLAEAMFFIKDDARYAQWNDRYMRDRDVLQAQSDREQLSGSKPRARWRV